MAILGDFEKKVTLSDAMDVDSASKASTILHLLARFLAVQKRRAEAYAKLRRGFAEYMISGADSTYQQLCSVVSVEFNEYSKQVLEIESLFLKADCYRDDLARLLRAVQAQEKQKLHLTATIQVLKKAGRPSERPLSHTNCRYKNSAEHECVHVREITDAAGTEDAEADAEYDSALKEAIKGLQDAVTTINEYLEEVRYEITSLESN